MKSVIEDHMLQDSQEENSNYIIPMRLSICHNTRSMYMQTMEDAVLYLDFNGFLPGEISVDQKNNINAVKGKAFIM